MELKEYLNITLATLILTIIISIGSTGDLSKEVVGLSLLSALIIISTNILGKNFIASQLDSGVSHEIWNLSRYGIKKEDHFKKPLPLGIILPLLASLLSYGYLTVSTLLSYEATGLKRRAVRRFGTNSFTEMTDWHIALIGAGGIITTLLVAFLSYWIPGLEILSRSAAYYALWNIIPFSKLDGMQIFMGSRVLWYALAIITGLFALGALTFL